MTEADRIPAERKLRKWRTPLPPAEIPAEASLPEAGLPPAGLREAGARAAGGGDEADSAAEAEFAVADRIHQIADAFERTVIEAEFGPGEDALIMALQQVSGDLEGCPPGARGLPAPFQHGGASRFRVIGSPGAPAQVLELAGKDDGTVPAGGPEGAVLAGEREVP